ncbi:MAG: hypothetical protein QM765_02560 [Myxococcales bacterium]
MNCIVWQNRAFHWDAGADGGRGALSEPRFWDLGVVGAEGSLEPRSCLLTNSTGTDASNFTDDPRLLHPLFNSYWAASEAGGRGHIVDVSLAPAGVRGDYHLFSFSPAIGRGEVSLLANLAALQPDLKEDLDGDARPSPAASFPDLGADERPESEPVFGPAAMDYPFERVEDPIEGVLPNVPSDAGGFVLGHTGGMPTGCGCTEAGTSGGIWLLLATAIGLAALRSARRV